MEEKPDKPELALPDSAKTKGKSDAHVRQQNMVRARKTRQRKKIRVNSILSNFYALLKYMEFLNSFILDNFLVRKTIVPSYEVHASSNTRASVSLSDIEAAEGIVGLSPRLPSAHAHPDGQPDGVSASIAHPQQHLASYSQRSLDFQVEIIEVEITRSIITNPKLNEAVESFRSTFMSSELKDIQDYLLTRRFTMPIVVKSLGDLHSENGPDETLSFRKERSRLHAQLTRYRKKLYTEKLVKASDGMENAIKAFHANLQEAGVALPAVNYTQTIEKMNKDLCAEDDLEVLYTHRGEDSDTKSDTSVGGNLTRKIKRQKLT